MRPVEAVTDIDESPLTKWLFGPYRRDILWRELQLPIPPRIEFELEPPEAPEGVCAPGNIDVLVCDPMRLEKAVAFESKLLKVTPEMFETLQPGKLCDLKKGARQANGLLGLGFHMSYLLVCVKIDGRQQPGNFASRGLSGPLVKIIYDHVNTLGLHLEVGIAVAEITQPAEKAIEDAGGICLKVVRSATRIEQSGNVTAWVRQQFRHSHRCDGVL